MSSAIILRYERAELTVKVDVVQPELLEGHLKILLRRIGMMVRVPELWYEQKLTWGTIVAFGTEHPHFGGHE